MSFGSVTVGTDTTLILESNSQRLSLIITNAGNGTVHIGQDASVTTSNAPFLMKNGSLTEDSGGTKMYCGPFYGMASSGSATVYFWERIR
jgi:hypothetical protein